MLAELLINNNHFKSINHKYDPWKLKIGLLLKKIIKYEKKFISFFWSNFNVLKM